MGSSWRTGRIATWTAIPFYLALSCGTPGEDSEGEGLRFDPVPAVEMADERLSEEPGTDADRSPSTGRVMEAELEALGGTDVVGTVSLSPGPQGTTVAVEIHGANSGLPYVAELVSGSCVSPGAVIAELGRITAGETGDGEFRQVLDPALLRSEQANRAVRVRGAGDPTAIVACGNVGAGSP